MTIENFTLSQDENAERSTNAKRAFFTLGNITTALAYAIEETSGNSIQDPNGSNQFIALHMGRNYLYTKVLKAKALAVQKSGEFWKVKEKGKGNRPSYDAEHAAGILDALVEIVESSSIKAEKMRQAHTNPNSIRRAEEILFNNPSLEKNYDLDEPLISFNRKYKI